MPPSLVAGIKQGEDGAVVVFDGIVRNNTRGRRTLFLVYEAYQEMALRQMQALAEEAIAVHGVRQVAMVHRLGRLEVGETSVLIAVASAHRAQAFEACRWLIDTLKKTVPIWKKEHFEDGAVWADGEPFPSSLVQKGTGRETTSARHFAARFTLCVFRPAQTGRHAVKAAATEPPTISVNVRLVNVFVNVTDDKGAPVPGLTKDEFLLSEDDHPQKIAVFERQSELPLEIVLAIDTSGSVHKDLGLEQEAAKHFVHSLLRPVDHLDLMEFADNVREVVFFTNNPGRIDRGLNDMGRGAATALYSGVYLASQSLAPRSGRKVLVIISDGGNTVKGTTYDMALEQALRGEVMVYPIIDVPISASAGRDLAGEHALITLAQETGGKYYYADASSLDRTFAQLSEDLRTQYLLGYYPSNRSGSGFRSISVKLRSPAAGRLRHPQSARVLSFPTAVALSHASED